MVVQQLVDEPPLVQACFHGDAAEVRTLISRKEDVNRQVNKIQEYVLFWIVSVRIRGHLEIKNFLEDDTQAYQIFKLTNRLQLIIYSLDICMWFVVWTKLWNEMLFQIWTARTLACAVYHSSSDLEQLGACACKLFTLEQRWRPLV